MSCTWDPPALLSIGEAILPPPLFSFSSLIHSLSLTRAVPRLRGFSPATAAVPALRHRPSPRCPRQSKSLHLLLQQLPNTAQVSANRRRALIAAVSAELAIRRRPPSLLLW